MCSWFITLPKHLKDINHKKNFFEKYYKFLNDKYGEQNVISAYVHKDDTNPYIYYLNKRDLQKFHSDLDKRMDQIFKS